METPTTEALQAARREFGVTHEDDEDNRADTLWAHRLDELTNG